MNRSHYILTLLFVGFSACTRVEDTPTSGLNTIDNTIYRPDNPYVVGFSFSAAELVPNNKTPGPDIILFVNTDNVPSRLTLQTENFKPSFSKVGNFADEAAAKAAYDNLKTVSVTQWADMADPISANQVWLYRSGSDTYAKIRIVSILNEVRQTVHYGECTFQWVYQPDGSPAFPGK